MPNQSVPLHLPAWYRELQQDPAKAAAYAQSLKDSETQPVAVPCLSLPAPPPGVIGAVLAVWSGAPVPSDPSMAQTFEDATAWLNAVSKAVAR